MISSDQYLSMIVGMICLGIITFCYRYSFISDQGKKFAQKIPENFLALLGPAVFSAIISNNILSQPSTPQEFRNKILVAVAALVVAYLTKNVLVTLLFGLALLHFVQT